MAYGLDRKKQQIDMVHLDGADLEGRKRELAEVP